MSGLSSLILFTEHTAKSSVSSNNEGCPSSTQDAQFCNTFGKQNWRIYPIQTIYILSDILTLDNTI